jgi:hypothetical protein
MRYALPLLTLSFAAATHAASIDALTQAEVARALRDALVQAGGRAVAQLGRENGFLADPRVRVPLPDSLQRADALARKFRMGSHSDALIETLNRAAEQAVAQAQPLLVEAVKGMTLSDAKRIVAGPDDAATRYFRSQTETALLERFLPIVRSVTSKLRLAEAYNRYARQGVRYGLMRQDVADLDRYVASKALDGLFVILAEEERVIRHDPLRQSGKLVRKVFGAALD